ncbi:MAG: hypothetical protein R3F37_23280 [Candidatus Competibacteraceae bacterium]
MSDGTVAFARETRQTIGCLGGIAMKEDAITTFNRRLRILAMFKGKTPLTTPMIHKRLQGTDEAMDERSVQRALAMLAEAGYLDVVNPDTKPLQWR